MTTNASPLDDYSKAVLAQIKAEHGASNIKLGDLAKTVGVSARAQQRYFAGEREMSIGLINAYAQALNIDLITLLQRARDRQD